MSETPDTKKASGQKGRGRNLYVNDETWSEMGKLAMSRDMSVSSLLQRLVDAELKREARRQSA